MKAGGRREIFKSEEEAMMKTVDTQCHSRQTTVVFGLEARLLLNMVELAAEDR